MIEANIQTCLFFHKYPYIAALQGRMRPSWASWSVRVPHVYTPLASAFLSLLIITVCDSDQVMTVPSLPTSQDYCLT